MKIKYYTYPIVAAITLIGMTAFRTPSLPAAETGFAVLELFTSQGCSSCPPADVVLGKYASPNNRNVMALSFHVDYWNSLGWKDPFSKAEFTARQKAYASALESSVYTPQMIINGSEAIVGSQETKIAKLVDSALSQKVVSTLHITSEKGRAGEVTVTYDCKNAAATDNLCVALVKKIETTAIKRGENGGKKLTNYNVVIEFKTTSAAKKTGNVIFSLDTTAKISDYQIIAFLQNPKDLKISAAAKNEIVSHF